MKSVFEISVLAALEILVNAFAEIAAVIALSMFEPTGRSSPAWTERVSVAWPPLASVATVWSSDAPAWIWTVAVNVPSVATVAGTSLTVTVEIASPSAFGPAVPVTVIVPAEPWIRLRAGDITLRTGGSASSAGAAAVASRREEGQTRDVARRKLRMAERSLSATSQAIPDSASARI